MSDRGLSRIAALLRKAEGTDNAHEADAYMAAAQRLATMESVDLAVARAHSANREKRVAPTQRTIEIGEAGKRGLRTYVQLFLMIGAANNITCDIARNSTKVFAYGFDTDIRATEALYASLVVQMVRTSDAYIKSGEYSSEVVIRQVRVERVLPGGRVLHRTRLVPKPVHATTARINFQEAFAARIGNRLMEARHQAQQQVIAADSAVAPGALTGVALALRDKEIELRNHYRATSTARGSWGGNRASAGHSEQSRRAGDRAARSAKLGSDTALGGSRPAITG
ncbi:DUF2786 domain-containing protein [Nakamurella antarctica]|uniref:DUF2786 domain-containing protein n=1 Tax=Nakamurella antarctica TaxID=1902245 RepID=A0A3G8ZI53_9ACTN|nr:DUF2786 domain-containing protein [Nakamurella antarctica]AZI56983.1 DUF2786 domain-containing protein [Nakamurella antarctica]